MEDTTAADLEEMWWMWTSYYINLYYYYIVIRRPIFLFRSDLVSQKGVGAEAVFVGLGSCCTVPVTAGQIDCSEYSGVQFKKKLLSSVCSFTLKHNKRDAIKYAWKRLKLLGFISHVMSINRWKKSLHSVTHFCHLLALFKWPWWPFF